MSGLNPHSLRTRLTFWYSCALVLVAVVVALASHWALAVSLDHALDQSLRYRLIGLHDFIDENSQHGLNHLAVRLRELDHLGELFQAFGPHGECMAQSAGLARHKVSSQPPPDPGPGILFRNAGPPWFPVRMATQRIYVAGQPLILEVADPQKKFAGVLSEFYSVLCLALPVVFAIAAFGGYWLSGRALRPVDRIISEARAIAPSNLAARLFVPTSGDELQRLSETLNQLLSRVEQSVQQVRRLTADASHELRAPMTLIYTAAEFALRRERSPDQLKDALQKILREAKRCTDLINQLLQLAQSDVGHSPLEPAPTNLTELVTDVVEELRLLAEDKGLHVSLHMPETSPRALVDKASFRRLLLILLDNAIKYTPPGGSVSVRLFESAPDLAIAIADTGSGMRQEDLPFIFDRFWRADKVRSREAGGSGLGLAIARDIADLHHAQLSVVSSLAEGSTFTIRLARQAKDPLDVQTPKEQSV